MWSYATHDVSARSPVKVKRWLTISSTTGVSTNSSRVDRVSKVVVSRGGRYNLQRGSFRRPFRDKLQVLQRVIPGGHQHRTASMERGPLPGLLVEFGVWWGEREAEILPQKTHKDNTRTRYIPQEARHLATRA